VQRYIQRSEIVNPATAQLLDRRSRKMKVERGAATAAAPFHPGFRRFSMNQ
jgi:hypothetical protein